MNTAIIFFTSCIIIGYALSEAQGNQYIYDKILDIEKIVIKDKTRSVEVVMRLINLPRLRAD